MASTVFQDAVPAVPATPITAAWLNDVNAMVYGGGNVLNQPLTSNFFSSSSAKINRLNDRVFIGGATPHDGAGVSAQADWLTTFQLATGRVYGFIEFSQTAVLTNSNQNAANAIVAGARTSTLAGVGNVIPFLGVAVNNNTTYATGAFGFYTEAYNMPGVLGAAFGGEIDTVNYRGAAPFTPYAQHPQEVVALQLAAGAELSPAGQYPSSAAINIWNNNSTFDRGIVFGSSSISGATGTSGTGIAVALGQGHMLQWYGSDSALTSSISCTVPAASSASATALEFASYGMRVKMANGGQGIATFIPIANASNYIQFVPATTGNSVQIQAQGADANVHLSLVPKGSGMLQFGAFTSGAPAANGYITILDNTGTPRKILVG